MPKSGLQKDVIQLYRACLRAVRSKPESAQENWYAYVRKSFYERRTVKKKDFSTIEYYLRIGHRKLEQYGQPGIKNIH